MAARFILTHTHRGRKSKIVRGIFVVTKTSFQHFSLTVINYYLPVFWRQKVSTARRNPMPANAVMSPWCVWTCAPICHAHAGRTCVCQAPMYRRFVPNYKGEIYIGPGANLCSHLRVLGFHTPHSSTSGIRNTKTRTVNILHLNTKSLPNECEKSWSWVTPVNDSQTGLLNDIFFWLWGGEVNQTSLFSFARADKVIKTCKDLQHVQTEKKL